MTDRRGVLFDLDGTLVDTNYLHVYAWWQAFREGGHDVDLADVHRRIGMGAPMLIEELVGKEDEELEEAHSRWYGQFLRQLRPFDGARELIRRCVDAGLVVVFASSASEQETEALLRALDVDDLVTSVTASHDVEDAKPEPDVVGVALERGGLAPDSALLVGDTVWDMKAASRAGVRGVAVLTGGIGRAELQEAGAIEVYDSVKALLDDFDASPLGRLAG